MTELDTRDPLDAMLRAALREDAKRAPALPDTWVGPDTFSLSPAEDRRPRRGLLVGGAAAAIVVTVAGSLALVNRDGNAPAAPPSTEPATPAPPMEEWPTELRSLVEPTLPDGFTAIYSRLAPSVIVAYNDDGVRIEVMTDLGTAPMNVDVEAPGFAQSPSGDWVTASVLYGDTFGDRLNEIPSGAPSTFADARDDLGTIVDEVASGLTDSIRERVLASAYPVIDSSRLRAEVDNAASKILGTQIANRALGATDFAFTYDHDEAAYNVAIVRAPEIIPDGIAQPSPTATSGRAWSNGWQLVITSTSADPDQAVTPEEMQELIDAIRPHMENWRPTIVNADACGQHVIEAGDSLASIAEEYGVTADGLRALNPDADVNMWAGATYQIPCPASTDESGQPAQREP